MMEERFREIAALIGDPVRAEILWTLTEGRPVSATEFAHCCGTSAQNISNHLSRLTKAGLIIGDWEGRHRYYRFSNREVAYAIEALNTLNPGGEIKQTKFFGDADIKICRSCYDHLAGRVGVQLTDALVAKKLILLKGNEYSLTRKGRIFFEDFGIDVENLKNERRQFARACLDWSERRYHIAGAFGAALLKKLFDLDYFRKMKNSRALIITSMGRNKLQCEFGIISL
jgi:DNA-binding transcriptional ArsR family regulator